MDVGVLLVQSADMLLQHGTWPNLSSIRMFGFTCYLAIITQFLNRHPALEQAKLPHPQVVLPLEDCMLSDGALPNLSSLEYQAGTAAAILQNPTAAQNLRNIAGINLRDMCRLEKRNGDPWDRVLALWRAHLTEGIKMRPSISSLKLLSYQPSYLLKLAGLAPQLTELDLDLFEDDFDPVSNIMTIYHAILYRHLALPGTRRALQCTRTFSCLDYFFMELFSISAGSA